MRRMFDDCPHLHCRSPIRMPDGMPISDPYQIIIEGIWGHGRVGYVAVDDISFFDGDCTSKQPYF